MTVRPARQGLIASDNADAYPYKFKGGGIVRVKRRAGDRSA
jgi:hypothetical protein